MVFETQSPVPVSCFTIAMMKVGWTKRVTARSVMESTMMRKNGALVRSREDFQKATMTDELTSVPVTARTPFTTQARTPLMVKNFEGELRT